MGHIDNLSGVVMISLTKSEKLQIAGLVVAVTGAVAGSILLEPLLIGAGVVGAGTAAFAKMVTTKRGHSPEPSSKYSSHEPQTSAMSSSAIEKKKEAASVHARKVA